MTAPTIVDLDALLAPFYDAETPPDGWRVGTEAEKFGVHRRTGQPLSYDGDDGIVQVLHRLVVGLHHARFRVDEREDPFAVGLSRHQTCRTQLSQPSGE